MPNLTKKMFIKRGKEKINTKGMFTKLWKYLNECSVVYFVLQTEVLGHNGHSTLKTRPPNGRYITEPRSEWEAGDDDVLIGIKMFSWQHLAVSR